MKLPRDILGSELVKALKVMGYAVVRQKGSHISIATEVDGPNKEVIPNHRPIKTGTGRSIFHLPQADSCQRVGFLEFQRVSASAFLTAPDPPVY